MADRGALRKIGLGFLGITVSVMLMAAVMVKSHLDGRLSLQDDASPSAASALIKAQ
jgi:hypothetical protein